MLWPKPWEKNYILREKLLANVNRGAKKWGNKWDKSWKMWQLRTSSGYDNIGKEPKQHCRVTKGTKNSDHNKQKTIRVIQNTSPKYYKKNSNLYCILFQYRCNLYLLIKLPNFYPGFSWQVFPNMWGWFLACTPTCEDQLVLIGT